MEINKENMRAPFFIQRRSTIIWSGSIVTVFLSIFLFGSYAELKNENEATSLLNLNAQLLVTILAVTISLYLLGLQFLAESYTTRSLIGYLRDNVVCGFLVIYILLISLNLVSSAFPSILPPIKFVQYSIIGTIFSLVYLVAFIFHVTFKIQPESLIFELSKNIRPDIWKDIIKTKGVFDMTSDAFKPFIILQQTMFRSIKNNDLYSFEEGLSLLFAIMSYSIRKTQPAPGEIRPENYRWDFIYPYKFFFRFLSSLVAECLKEGREQFIIQYQWHMFKEIKIIHSQRHHHALRDFWRELDYIGYKVFSMEMISASEFYLRQLKQLMIIELETISKIDNIPRKDAFMNKKRSTEEIIDDILESDFQFQRLRSLTNFGEIAAKKRMDNVLSSILFSLRELLDKVLTIEDRITRRSNLYSIIRAFTSVHKASADMQIHSNLWSTDWLHMYIEKIGDKYPDDSKFITERFCDMSLYSIKKGYYDEIRVLGDNGVLLVDTYPEPVLIILDSLYKAFGIVNEEKDAEIRIIQINKIKDEITSIAKWNKNNNPMVIEKTEKILQDIDTSDKI